MHQMDESCLRRLHLILMVMVKSFEMAEEPLMVGSQLVLIDLHP